jgi:hypothetical protein
MAKGLHGKDLNGDLAHVEVLARNLEAPSVSGRYAGPVHEQQPNDEHARGWNSTG